MLISSSYSEWTFSSLKYPKKNDKIKHAWYIPDWPSITKNVQWYKYWNLKIINNISKSKEKLPFTISRLDK